MSKAGYTIQMSQGRVTNVFGEKVPQHVRDIKSKANRVSKRKPT